MMHSDLGELALLRYRIEFPSGGTRKLRRKRRTPPPKERRPHKALTRNGQPVKAGATGSVPATVVVVVGGAGAVVVVVVVTGAAGP